MNTSNWLLSSGFKQGVCGHWFESSLEKCPYCNHIENTFSQTEDVGVVQSEEEWNPLNNTAEEIVFIARHGYVVDNYNKVASFACWSQDSWDEYIKYWLWKSDKKLAKEDNFTKRIKSEKVFCIPHEIEYNGQRYPVICIRSGAVSFCEINSIIIPNTILHIDRQAFFRCDGLQNLVIPDSVKNLSMGAISECKDLKTITWRGTTYEDDIDELFIFPDDKDKYAIKENIYDKYDDLCPPSWLIEETYIPRCPHCGKPIRKSIPIVNWPIIGSIEGGAYDHKVPWNYQWNGICENCGHDFNIKMAQNIEKYGISRHTTIKVSGKSVPTRFRDAHVGFSGVEIEQNTREETVKMFISTNELKFLLNELKNSPILDQWDWKEDYT